MSFNIRITKEEWNRCLSSDDFISTRNDQKRKRKTFLAPFSHLLSEKLQVLGKLFSMIL